MKKFFFDVNYFVEDKHVHRYFDCYQAASRVANGLLHERTCLIVWIDGHVGVWEDGEFMKAYAEQLTWAKEDTCPTQESVWYSDFFHMPEEAWN